MSSEHKQSTVRSALKVRIFLKYVKGTYGSLNFESHCFEQYCIRCTVTTPFFIGSSHQIGSSECCWPFKNIIYTSILHKIMRKIKNVKTSFHVLVKTFTVLLLQTTILMWWDRLFLTFHYNDCADFHTYNVGVDISVNGNAELCVLQKYVMRSTTLNIEKHSMDEGNIRG
jgi:hypothetical protein